MARTMVNAALFQLVWFAAVLGAAHEQPGWGWVALAVFIAQVLTTSLWRIDLAFAVVCMAIGFLVDSLWSWSGVLRYVGDGLAPGDGLASGNGLAPVWILTLWAATGLSLNHSLGWFRTRALVGGLAAGAMAPISYLAGERLGAISVPAPALLGWVALSWVPIFGILFALANSLAGEQHDPR